MWKETATRWESKKNLSTGGVVKWGFFSTRKIVEKNNPQAVFHMSPKSGGNTHCKQ
jgi:hypothetical protein